MKLHEYVAWARNDLAYRAPELWPARIAEFFEFFEERYPNIEESDDDDDDRPDTSA